MKDAYPFRGVWRWLLLPLWMIVWGVLRDVLGCAWAGDFGFLKGWMLLGAIQGFTVGVALTAGPRPAIAATLAFALAMAETRVFETAAREILGTAVSMDDSTSRLLLVGVHAALIVSAQLLHLRLRVRGASGSLAALGIYVLVHVAETSLWAALDGVRAKYFLIAAGDAVLAWAMLAAAARVSEKVGPRA